MLLCPGETRQSRGIATKITQELRGSPVTSESKEAWKMPQPAAEAACVGAGSCSAFLEGDGAEEAGTFA